MDGRRKREAEESESGGREERGGTDALVRPRGRYSGRRRRSLSCEDGSGPLLDRGVRDATSFVGGTSDVIGSKVRFSLVSVGMRDVAEEERVEEEEEGGDKEEGKSGAEVWKRLSLASKSALIKRRSLFRTMSSERKSENAKER